MKTHMEIWIAKIPYDGEVWKKTGDNELEELIDRLNTVFEEWKGEVLSK